jgi:hypothetical protein
MLLRSVFMIVPDLPRWMWRSLWRFAVGALLLLLIATVLTADHVRFLPNGTTQTGSYGSDVASLVVVWLYVAVVRVAWSSPKLYRQIRKLLSAYSRALEEDKLVSGLGPGPMPDSPSYVDWYTWALAEPTVPAASVAEATNRATNLVYHGSSDQACAIEVRSSYGGVLNQLRLVRDWARILREEARA